MDKRRVRYGLMLPDNKFVELLSMKRSSSGFILWTPKSRKHFTIVDEDVSLSSHKINQIDGIRKHIGRMKKDINVDDDEFLEKMYKPR